MRLSKKIFIITGPSAAGKTTITSELLKKFPLARVITTTSRPRRSGEREGRDYRFITSAKFEQMVKADKMFEWAKYANHYYGSQKHDVERIVKSGKHPVWIVDTQGADFFERKYKRTVTIFIMPSSFSILRRRLEKRKLPESEIRARLKTAGQEIKKAPRYDYRVINYDGRLEKVVEDAAKIVRRELS